MHLLVPGLGSGLGLRIMPEFRMNTCLVSLSYHTLPTLTNVMHRMVHTTRSKKHCVWASLKTPFFRFTTVHFELFIPVYASLQSVPSGLWIETVSARLCLKGHIHALSMDIASMPGRSDMNKWRHFVNILESFLILKLTPFQPGKPNTNNQLATRVQYDE